jgi:hypothetical protein
MPRPTLAEAAVFCPTDADPQVNMDEFVRWCRVNSKVFGARLNFDDDIWDVTESLALKGRGKKHTRITFYKFKIGQTVTTEPMPEPFILFAKAYLRYMHGLRPIKFIGARLYALKAICWSLEQQGVPPDATRVTDAVLTGAAQYIRQEYAASLAYRVGQRLEEIGEAIRNNRLVRAPIRWVNFLPRPGDTARVGLEFDKRRASKLPSEAALEALPQIFHRATQPADVLITSGVALMLSSPDRINEVLLLPADCETTYSESGKETYGLRWWPSKGADPTIKWVRPSMVDTVRLAVNKIRSVTAPARQIAQWYENHQEMLYLLPPLEHLRQKEWLATADVREIVGLPTMESAATWVRSHRLPVRKNPHLLVRFSDLEKAIVAMLPEGFPILDRDLGIKYSDALFVVRKNEFHARRGTYLCMVEPPSVDRFNMGTGCREDVPDMFSRFGFTESNGEPIRITSHQFRHYLHTIADLGGLGEVDLAKWAGRLDIRQNRAYSHVSSAEILESMRSALGDESLIYGPLGRIPKKLVTRAEFASLKIPTAHTTPIGFCIHDWAMTPCCNQADCISCEELVCLKGDENRGEKARRLLSETRCLLDGATKAAADRGYGSDRWIEHWSARVVWLEQLCSILDDPNVPVGSWISFSRSPDAKLLSGSTGVPHQSTFPILN